MSMNCLQGGREGYSEAHQRSKCENPRQKTTELVQTQTSPRRESRPAYFNPVPVFALAQNGDGIHLPGAPGSRPAFGG